MKNTQQWCEKNLINIINLMIHYNYIEIFPKEVCDVVVPWQSLKRPLNTLVSLGIL